MPRLAKFSEKNPDIDVRIKAVDTEASSLTDDVDVAIYYGLGNWPGLRADKLRNEVLIPVCSPMLLNGPKPLSKPSDLKYHTLLHDMNRHDWQAWFRQCGINDINVNQGPIFSHSSLVLQAAAHGQGVALGYSVLARPDIKAGRLVCPFQEVLVSKDAYYLVCQQNHAELGKVVAFREWMLDMFAEESRSELLPG